MIYPDVLDVVYWTLLVCDGDHDVVFGFKLALSTRIEPSVVTVVEVGIACHAIDRDQDCDLIPELLNVS